MDYELQNIPVWSKSYTYVPTGTEIGGAGFSMVGAGMDKPISALNSCESSSLAYALVSTAEFSSSSSKAAKLAQSSLDMQVTGKEDMEKGRVGGLMLNGIEG